MTNKTLNERIAEIIKKLYSEYPNAKLSLNIQAKAASDVADIIETMLEIIQELQAELEGTNKLYEGALSLIMAKDEKLDELNNKVGKKIAWQNFARTPWQPIETATLRKPNSRNKRSF